MHRDTTANSSAVQKKAPFTSSRQSSRRRFPVKLRYVAVAVLLSIAAYHYFTVQRVQLAQLNQKQEKLHTELVQLQAQHSKLSKEQQQLNDKSYIARYAAEHYHLILPGQIPFDLSH